MKKICTLYGILILSFHIVDASKKNDYKQNVVKICYFDYIPLELILIILNKVSNTYLARVNSMFYSLIQGTDWYLNKQCNRIIKIIISYLSYLDYRNYKKIIDPHFLKSKFTSGKNYY